MNDYEKVLGVVITVKCHACEGAGTLEAEWYLEELICPRCNGSGHASKEISLDDFRQTICRHPATQCGKEMKS